MSKKETVKNEKTVKYSNIPETPQDHARRTREMIKKKGIKSPDVSNMIHLKRGNTTYCFYKQNRDKYNILKKQFELEDEKERQRLAFYENMNLSKPVSKSYLVQNNLTCRDCKKIVKSGKSHYRCSDPRNVTGFKNGKQVMLKTKACIYFEGNG